MYENKNQVFLPNMTFINREKFDKIEKVRFSDLLGWIDIGSMIQKQFSLWSGQPWDRR